MGRKVQIVVEIEHDRDLLDTVARAATAAIARARETFVPEMLPHIGKGGCFYRAAHSDDYHALVLIGPPE